MICLIIGVIVSAAVGALITGLILTLIAPITANRQPTYGEAFKTMFIAHIVSGIVRAGIALVMSDADTGAPNPLATGIGALAALAVLTAILSNQLEAPIGRAFLTALTMTVILAVLAFALAFAIVLATGGAST